MSAASDPPEPEPEPTRALLLAQALETCIQAERQVPGSADHIIAHQPAWMRAELRRLLALAGSLDAAATGAVMSDEFRAAARARLLRRISPPRDDRTGPPHGNPEPPDASPVLPSSPWGMGSVVPAEVQGTRRSPARKQRSRWVWRGALGGILAAVLATLATLSASASSLPGQPLYGLKQATEELGVWLAPDDQARTLILLRQANARLDETAQLLEQGRTDKAADATQRFDDALDRATTTYVVLTMATPGAPEEPTSAQLKSAMSRQQMRLQALLATAPEPARAELRQALAATRRGLALVTDDRAADDRAEDSAAGDQPAPPIAASPNVPPPSGQDRGEGDNRPSTFGRGQAETSNAPTTAHSGWGDAWTGPATSDSGPNQPSSGPSSSKSEPRQTSAGGESQASPGLSTFGTEHAEAANGSTPGRGRREGSEVAVAPPSGTPPVVASSPPGPVDVAGTTPEATPLRMQVISVADAGDRRAVGALPEVQAHSGWPSDGTPVVGSVRTPVDRVRRETQPPVEHLRIPALAPPVARVQSGPSNGHADDPPSGAVTPARDAAGPDGDSVTHVDEVSLNAQSGPAPRLLHDGADDHDGTPSSNQADPPTRVAIPPTPPVVAHQSGPADNEAHGNTSDSTQPAPTRAARDLTGNTRDSTSVPASVPVAANATPQTSADSRAWSDARAGLPDTRGDGGSPTTRSGGNSATMATDARPLVSAAPSASGTASGASAGSGNPSTAVTSASGASSGTSSASSISSGARNPPSGTSSGTSNLSSVSSSSGSSSSGTSSGSSSPSSAASSGTGTAASGGSANGSWSGGAGSSGSGGSGGWSGGGSRR